jgi:hypothetical protein
MDSNSLLRMRKVLVTGMSGASGRYPQPIAVRVFEMHLTTGKALLVYRKAELLGDAVDVIDVEMNEGVRSRVTLVLREVEVDVSSCDGNEPRKAGLELMLPFLFEPEPLVPGDSARRVLGVEDRNNLLVHAAEITRARGKERIAWASVSLAGVRGVPPGSQLAKQLAPESVPERRRELEPVRLRDVALVDPGNGAARIRAAVAQAQPS